VIVVADARDALAQFLIGLLQPIVLLVELGFFAAQAPKVERAALADDGDQGEQQDQ